MSYSSEEISEEQLAILADLEMLREDLVAELQAINQYEDHMLNLANEGAVTALERIIDNITNPSLLQMRSQTAA